MFDRLRVIVRDPALPVCVTFFGLSSESLARFLVASLPPIYPTSETKARPEVCSGVGKEEVSVSLGFLSELVAVVG
jgi:hypothetical protein